MKRLSNQNRTLLIPVLAATLGLTAFNVRAQDPVAVCPNNFKVLAEDDTTRVSHFTQKKGKTCAMHSHPYVVVYVIKPGRINFVMADGSRPKTPANPVKAGDVVQRGPVTHAHESA